MLPRCLYRSISSSPNLPLCFCATANVGNFLRSRRFQSSSGESGSGSAPRIKLFDKPIEALPSPSPLKNLNSVLSLIRLRLQYDSDFSPISLTAGASQALVSVSQAIYRRDFAALQKMLDSKLLAKVRSATESLSEESFPYFNIKEEFISEVMRLYSKFRWSTDPELFFDVFFIYEIVLGGARESQQQLRSEAARRAAEAAAKGERLIPAYRRFSADFQEKADHRVVMANLLLSRKIVPDLSDWKITSLNYFRLSDAVEAIEKQMF